MELQELVNAYITARETRLEQNRTLEILEKAEAHAKNEVITQMQHEGSTVFGASKGTVTLQKKIKPTATDWSKVWEYIFETKAQDLVQKRLGEAAIKARWEDGVKIPGVEEFIVFDLTVGKARNV